MRYATLAAVVATLSAVAFPALADKVAVLPFSGGPGTLPSQIEQARAATRGAVIQRAHQLSGDSEMVAALMAVADGVADTSAEFRAAGRASSSQWTVVGQLEARGESYKIEIVVCQVESGRVESLAREMTPVRATSDIAEMLALLLRPQGLANAVISWDTPSEIAAKPPKPVVPAEPPKTVAPVEPPKPVAPPAPPALAYAYGEDHPIAAGVGTAVFGALDRPANAVGSSASGVWFLTGEYAVLAAPGLAARADVGASWFGPQSFWLDAGARYAFPLARGHRLFAGPELDLGVFVPIGGDRAARFLLRGQAFVVYGLGDRVQLELAADFATGFGGSGTLALGGGAMRGLFRF